MSPEGPGCPFCALEGERIIWQSDLSLAIRDNYPVSDGHTLILPRRHVETYFDATPEEHHDLWQAVLELKHQLDESHHPAGYNVGFNSGAAAGQTVMHLHIHVIPRYPGDVEDPRGGIRGAVPHKQRYGGPRLGS